MAEHLEGAAIAQMREDLERADLGDPRRVARAQRVMERLARQPGASLPDALVTDAELEGAYRLFGNERVTFERLFDAHAQGTAERARDRKVVLAMIFLKARDAVSVVITKDEDFVRLVERNGPPPQVIWVTSGNMPNDRFKSLLLKTLRDAISLIASGETVVEIHQRM
jgi:predicted nuclease of predicted toxin-antitoxin system